jgi:hypothetical protein
VVDTSSLQPPPTAVLAASLSARRTRQGVELSWRSASPGVLAWTVARGVVRIGRVDAAGPGRYRFLDRTPPRGRTRYVLEAMRPDLTRVGAGAVEVAASG